ncbi:MAG: hypothetical protein IH586_11955, partial [Anaerolineaceae bacterium]|nr:hypothetical protein [Anaerolineaceae bacterium]
MKRRAFSLSILLVVLCMLLTTTQRTDAETQGNSTRLKSVEIKTVEYVWDLVSNQDGRVICQIIIEHPFRPTNQETITICAEQIFPPEPTSAPLPTPTPGDGKIVLPPPIPIVDPFDLADFFRSVTFRFVTTQELIRTIQVPVPEMIINIVVPPYRAGAFFVSIYAYEPVIGEHITEIRGSLDGWEFACSATRCDVPITTDSILEFWALSSYGDESQHLQATLRVVRTDQGERIELSSLVPIKLYQDACANIWGMPRYQMPTWADLPTLPDELNTQKPYQYLAGKLLYAGIANGQGCPGGGLLADGAPNACGLERASKSVIDWQNQFDLVFWDTARQIGIPPRLLKVLIEQESQFWPANGRRLAYEYGLGQLSQAGADVVLRYDNELFNQICNGLLYDCSIAYGRLPSWVQATVRGGLMRLMNSECATCANGIDLAHAQDSIPVLARTLRSNCRQVKYIMDTKGLKSTYEDMWKLTFVSYHSGYECLATALDFLNYNELPADWENISMFLGCPGARSYVDNAWKSLETFDLYRVQHPDRDKVVALATFVPKPSPTIIPTQASTPTPTVNRSLAHILVLVYIDKNGNNYPEENEKVDNIAVEAQFEDGSTLSAQTAKGEAVIDLSGRPVGGNVTILLPDLYRTQK